MSQNLKPYSEHPDADSNRSSAVEALQHVLRLPNSVRLSHKKHLLRHAIWLFTTADGRNSTHGKMNIRYVSEGVLKGGSDIRHEHIVPIRELINQLLEEP